MNLMPEAGRKELFLLTLIAALSSAACLSGIGWGTPSVRAKELVLPAGLQTPRFLDAMKRTRDLVLRKAEDSAVGRSSGADGRLTPILESMGITSPRNTGLPRDEATLANLARPYLLRTNHTDEQMTLVSLAGMRPKKLDFDPKFYAYGGGYIYGMGALFGAGHVLGLIRLTGDISAYLRDPGKIAAVFVLGRSVNAAFLALTVVLLFLTVKKLAGQHAGLIAAALYAFNPAVVFEAHIMKPYTLAALFCAACLYFSARISGEDSRRRDYLLAGLFAGLAAGTMILDATVIAAPLAAHFSRGRRPVAGLFHVALGAVPAFLLLNPYWVLSITRMVSEMGSSRGVYASGFSPRSLLKTAVSAQYAMISHALLAAYLAGTAYALSRRRYIYAGAAAAAAFLPLVWLMQNQDLTMHQSRVYLPFYLAASAGGAVMLGSLLRAGRTAALLLCLAISSEALLYCAAVTRNFIDDASPRSTRLRAGEWIAENIPADSTVGLIDMPQPAMVPPFPFSKYRLTLLFDMAGGSGLPEYLVARDDFRDRDVSRDIHLYYDQAAVFSPGSGLFGINLALPPSHVNSRIAVYRSKAAAAGKAL